MMGKEKSKQAQPSGLPQCRHLPARRSPRASAASQTSGSSRLTLAARWSARVSGDAALVTLLLPVSTSMALGLSVLRYAWEGGLMADQGGGDGRSTGSIMGLRPMG